MTEPRHGLDLRPCGDSAVLVDLRGPDARRRLDDLLSGDPPAGLIDLVPARTTLLLRFGSPAELSDAVARLRAVASEEGVHRPRDRVEHRALGKRAHAGVHLGEGSQPVVFRRQAERVHDPGIIGFPVKRDADGPYIRIDGRFPEQLDEYAEILVRVGQENVFFHDLRDQRFLHVQGGGHLGRRLGIIQFGIFVPAVEFPYFSDMGEGEGDTAVV